MPYSDHSTCVRSQSCPRSRYLEHEIPNGTLGVKGIVPNRINMDFLTGGTFHEGVHYLLLGKTLEEAVQWSLHRPEEPHDRGGFWAQIATSGLAVEETEDANYVAWEQASLSEALIRAYAVVVLPQLLDRFEVVEAEREDVSLFTDPSLPGFELTWGSRTDGLLIEKETGLLYILSLKTAKEWYKDRDRNNRYDMQGLTETAAVEQRLQKWQGILESPVDDMEGFKDSEVPEWFLNRWNATGVDPSVTGVKMEFALKGSRRETVKGSGRWAYDSNLIRPYKKGDAYGAEYAAWFSFQDELGGNHRLGKGWNRVNIWEEPGGVKAWIEHLATKEVQGRLPGAALEAAFILPDPYLREPEHVESKIRQILYQEEFVEEGRNKLRLYGAKDRPRILDKYFPQHSDYPSKCTACPYESICWGMGIDPIGSGMFKPRVPNHPIELEVS